MDYYYCLIKCSIFLLSCRHGLSHKYRQCRNGMISQPAMEAQGKLDNMRFCLFQAKPETVLPLQPENFPNNIHEKALSNYGNSYFIYLVLLNMDSKNLHN